MTFLIIYRNYLENTTVRVFDDATAAKAWIDPREDPALTGRVVSGPFDIEGSKKYMIDLFNALAREGDDRLSPTGFNNRATGQTRIFERLTQYYGNLPITVVEPQPESEISSETQQEDDMAKKKVKKSKTIKKTKSVKVAKTPRVKGELRKGTIAAEVAALWGRDRGASKAETLAIIVPKFPEKEATALDNTVRGYVNSLPKTTGRKLRKEKDEKRGLVYYLA